MKAALILLVALLTPVSGSAGAVDLTQHPYDKASHIALGGALSCAVTSYTERPWAGILAAVAAGALKESTDLNFDRGDFASWGVGGLVGSLCIVF